MPLSPVPSQGHPSPTPRHPDYTPFQPLTEQRLCPGMSSSPPTRLLLILQVKQHLPVNAACGSLASASTVEAGVLPLHSCYSSCYSSCCTLLPALNCPHSFPACAPHQIMSALGQVPCFSSRMSCFHHTAGHIVSAQKTLNGYRWQIRPSPMNTLTFLSLLNPLCLVIAPLLFSSLLPGGNITHRLPRPSLPLRLVMLTFLLFSGVETQLPLGSDTVNSLVHFLHLLLGLQICSSLHDHKHQPYIPLPP